MILRLGLVLPLLFAPSLKAEDCHVTPGWESMEIVAVELSREPSQELFEMSVRKADSAAKRAAGYQWICERDALDTAVLFVFPRTVPSAFHMRNVYVPLDIHFFDSTGQQVDAMVMRPEPPGSNLEPRYYRPAGSFRYALEVARPHSHDLESAPARLRLLVDSL